MLNDRQARFVEQPRIGRLGTTRADGAPHIAPIWYRYQDGAFLILTEGTSTKARNIEHDPRVVLCIDDDEPPYHTVLVRGTARLEPAHDPAWRLALAVHYLGEERGRRYIAQNDAPDNVLIRIEVQTATGW